MHGPIFFVWLPQVKLSLRRWRPAARYASLLASPEAPISKETYETFQASFVGSRHISSTYEYNPYTQTPRQDMSDIVKIRNIVCVKNLVTRHGQKRADTHSSKTDLAVKLDAKKCLPLLFVYGAPSWDTNISLKHRH